MAVMFPVGEGQPLRTTHMRQRFCDSATLFPVSVTDFFATRVRIHQ
jgi:hypothetical protein